MKKKILLVLLFSLLFSFSVYAQNTNVTATITDAGGQTWNNGTYTFNFSPAPRFNGTYRQNGAPFTPTSISGTLSAVGALTSIPVPDNNQITPSGTGWTLTVCAQTGVQCFTSATIVITGASQTISSSVIPPAITVTCGPGVNAYLDSEVSCGVGGHYYNLTNQVDRVCTAVTTGVCTTWANAGGSSSSSSQITNNFINAGSATYGVTAAGNEVCDASSTNTSQTVTTPANDPPFTAAMNGWTVFGSNTCADGITYASQVPIGTLTFVSAHTITVSVAAVATNTGGLHLVFMPIEDAQLTLAENAAFNYATTNGACYALQLPGGLIGVALPHFNTFNCNTQYTGPASNGAHIQGVGRVATRLMLVPNFNFANCPLFNSIKSCFGAAAGVTMLNMGITGGHQPGANPAAATCIKNDSTDDYTINFLLAGFGAALGNLRAYCTSGLGATPQLLIEDGMGSVGWFVSALNQSCVQCFFGNNATAGMQNSGATFLQTYGTGWGPTSPTAGETQFSGAGSQWISTADIVLISAGSNYVLCNSGALCNFDGLHLFGTASGNMSGFVVTSGAGHISIRNSSISAGPTGVIWNMTTGTALGDDMGGNAFTFTGAAGYASLTAGSAVRTMVPTSTYSTPPSPGLTDCASSAGTCAQHLSGSVSIAAAATTVTVATTAVLANSTIYVFEDSSLGTKLGVTCNTSGGRTYTVTTRTAGTSFIITAAGTAIATNPACLNWEIR